MKKPIFYLLLSLTLITACKDKAEKKEGDTDPSTFFPVSSYLKSQVAKVDTSLYRIIKVVSRDSISDTIFIAREEFRKEANEFLNIPDLTVDKSGKKYKEEKMYDETLGRAILTYLPVNDKMELLKQEVIIIPGFGGEDRVRSIILEKRKANDDSTVITRLLWQVDESFQVVRIVEKKKQDPFITTTEVIWNKPESSENIQQIPDTTEPGKKEPND